MPSQSIVQYTVRGVPKELDSYLRKEANLRGISLNQLIVERLQESSASNPPVRRRSLDFLKGLWIEDANFDEALADQRRVDEDLWK